MKKLFLSALACLLAIGGSAQNSIIPVATLDHDGKLTVYEGGDALINAYNASVEGDLITLSSGRFTAVCIEKNITLRGAGFMMDSVNSIAPTEIVGDFYVKVAENNGNRLTIEGILHNGRIVLSNVSFTPKGIHFLKSLLNKLDHDGDPYWHRNVSDIKFIQCRIKDLSLRGDATIVNSYVGNPRTSSYQMKYNCINCVVTLAEGNNLGYSNFTNCVFIGTEKLNTTNTASNCVGVYTHSTDTVGNIFSNLPDYYNNVCYRDAADVFKTFTGTYSDDEDFVLQEAIKTKHPGSDETEVGMYGGYYPFSHITTAPQIRKFIVDRKSTTGGKLNVEVEVVDGSEIVEQ